uniref:Lcl C-terminal domain-containing protein n=1 Tax=Desulfovibrio sp. U5L TaxID=596152 RepID=I2Q206_9BACT
MRNHSPTSSAVPPTGQTACHDRDGREIPCPGSGQDAAFHGAASAFPDRFAPAGPGLVADRVTGLLWPVDAGLAGFPLPWAEALALVTGFARDRLLGRNDWRLPNRRELRSLVSYGAARPSLPPGHPFRNVFLGWHWSSTTAAPAPGYAWYVHLEGGRMFYGKKDQDCLCWPVAGTFRLPQTGQDRCFDGLGKEAACPGSGQDGEILSGRPWPTPRFIAAGAFGSGEAILDRLTGLVWAKRADAADGPVAWEEGLAVAAAHGDGGWRLPDINELESLVDAGEAFPALPAGHPFTAVGEAYWSSTTSAFEKNWAHALYLHKGAVGVGFKSGREFLVWPVRGTLP